MRRILILTLLLTGIPGAARAQGILVPADRSLPRPVLVRHDVRITLEDQVAVTRVEQTFRNDSGLQMEATYVFPVPKGASVNEFTMWVNGKEVRGEMVEAARARQIYTDIVRRTCDPGLLEYIGNNLLQLRVFPILPHSDQKIALSYTSVAQRDESVVEFVYPLKTDGRTHATLEKLSIEATIRSQNPIHGIYSPTHAVIVANKSEKEATVTFERNQTVFDKDFQLFYSTGDKDIGFTMLPHRPISGDKGHFLMLLSPRFDTTKRDFIPRDMVLVLDTSGSMRGVKMDQARRALKYCLQNLDERDSFAILNFASTVHKYRDDLAPAKKEYLEQAKKWVDDLEANGGTAIDDALTTALSMRGSDRGRTFTIVFFTDGEPTVGETNPENILRNANSHNSANTRIFTFGVGDDVNATLLDRLAEQTRAVSTYVRPAEDIEAKVSSLVSKISHPVLADLKLTTGDAIRLDDIYPTQLPDLYHGGQLVVLGRYSGSGPATVTLSGTVGQERREFTYEIKFPERTDSDRHFVEQIWARRKVGYLLDQIRANGEKKELVDETVALAKRYGIATPYTSYLVVPDGPMPVTRRLGGMGQPRSRGGLGAGLGSAGLPGGGGIGGGFGGGLGMGAGSAGQPQSVLGFAEKVQNKPGDISIYVDRLVEQEARQPGAGGGPPMPELQRAADRKFAYDQAKQAFATKQLKQVQSGKLSVDLSVDANNLRNQDQLAPTAVRQVNGRNCVQIAGVWIDDGFDAKLPKLVIKAQSTAYFRLLERQPQVKDVLKLGNALVWVAPNGTALVIDANDGKETLTDEEIDALFATK